MIKYLSFVNKTVIHVLLIIVIGLFIYSNTFSVPFYFDDKHNIVQNHAVRDLRNFWPPGGTRWFGMLTFALNYYFHGLDVTGYHIVNLLIHLVNALLVYGLLTLTLPLAARRGKAPESISTPLRNAQTDYIPLLTALFFVSHPVQTQAVTYIVQRLASLAAMLYLLTLFFYILARRSPHGEDQGSGAKRHVFYLISLVSAVLAMVTKEVAFTLPLSILLYDYAFFDDAPAKRFAYLSPFLATMLIIPAQLVGSGVSAADLLSDVGEVTKVATAMPRLHYLYTQFRVMATYLRILIVPVGQNLDYDYPIFTSFIDLNVILSFLLIASLAGAGLFLLWRHKHNVQRVRSPYPLLIAFGILWFFLTLTVESSIIPIVDVVFEHRIYLPSVGFFTAVSTAFVTAAERLETRSIFARIVLSAVMILILAINSLTTYARNDVWRDPVKLWEDVVRKSPRKARPHENLGVAYRAQGRPDDALREYQTALRIDPDFAEAHYDLGNLYLSMERHDLAAKEYEAAVKLKPAFPFAHYNLALYYADHGRIDDAVREFQAVIRLNPYSAYAYNGLGVLYLRQGKYREARKYFEAALSLSPDLADARRNLENIDKKKMHSFGR